MSAYLNTLDSIHAVRYREKTLIIGTDPYLLKYSECSQNVKDYPKIMYPDIVNYLFYKKKCFHVGRV